MKFTILGADGWIGAALVQYLTAAGYEVEAVTRKNMPAKNRALGHAIYAIGLTADFRSKTFETMDAHITKLAYCLQHFSFDSFLYLSSARVFGSKPAAAAVNEQTPITITPNADSLYDLSKLAGEALCLAQSLSSVRVARLSNVYGRQQNPHTFLGSILLALRETGQVVLNEGPNSAKDYVALADVVSVLEKIALHGSERIYHVASGMPISHAALANALTQRQSYRVTFRDGAVPRIFPTIDISRLRGEFDFSPRSLLDELPTLLRTKDAV